MEISLTHWIGIRAPIIPFHPHFPIIIGGYTLGDGGTVGKVKISQRSIVDVHKCSNCGGVGFPRVREEINTSRVGDMSRRQIEYWFVSRAWVVRYSIGRRDGDGTCVTTGMLDSLQFTKYPWDNLPTVYILNFRQSPVLWPLW